MWDKFLKYWPGVDAPELSPSLLRADVGIVIVLLTVLDTKSGSSTGCVAATGHNMIINLHYMDERA